MSDYSENYLLDKKIKILQPIDGYRASTDAVLLSAAVKDVKKGDTILDIGSGTGAISLCLAARFADKQISITGLEIQEELANLANKSAEENGFQAFLHYRYQDFLKTDLPPCTFAHVISNPPYSDHDMPSPNIGKATAHNFSQADLSVWIKQMIKMIKPRGFFYMVNRAEALDSILAEVHGKLGKIEVFPLYSKNGQAAKRIIVRAQKDSKAPLVIHSPFVIHEEGGEYSPKAQRILRQGEILD